MLASFVAWQTSLPGVSFASCGLPGYSAAASHVENFVSFLESGGPDRAIWHGLDRTGECSDRSFDDGSLRNRRST